MDAANSSEISVYIYQTTRRHIPENGYFHASYAQGYRQGIKTGQCLLTLYFFAELRKRDCKTIFPNSGLCFSRTIISANTPL